jgi:predicted negative regulator of RcsB-dependent stress response
MRRGFITAVISVLVVGFAAFFGGEAWERYESKAQAAGAVSLQSASQHAEALFIARSALARLHEGRPADAQLVLARYAKLQAAALGDCSKAVQCSAWVGKLMPTQAELAEIASMTEAR